MMNPMSSELMMNDGRTEATINKPLFMNTPKKDNKLKNFF